MMISRSIRALLCLGALTWIGGCTRWDAQSSPNAPAPTMGSTGAPAAPQDRTSVANLSTRQLRRLSSREYNNVIRDLLGDNSRPADQFIRDAYENGYDNGSVGLAVQSDQVFGYENAAEALAASAAANAMNLLISGCDVATQGEPACEDGFLTSFAPRAYRRPLTATEIARLRDMFDAGAATGGFAVGIQTALELILQSPQFLYREELGPPDTEARSGSPIAMTDYEVASELSFLLTGSIPDSELWAAVEKDQFKTAADRRQQATRLLASSGARETLRAFLHQWLGTDRVPGLSKDPLFYPAWSAAMAASMATELDRFYDASLFSGDASLRSLFTSNQSFADATLGDLYGVAAPAEGFGEVTLDPLIRSGILSRAGYLAVHAATDSSGPVSRGVFVLQSILCSPPLPPPPDVPAALPATDSAAQNLTTRARFEAHVSNARCAACHLAIDGIGFGFEEFDGIGAYRTTDNGQPVDSSGTVVGTGEIDGDYNGVSELSARLSGSQHLADCYVRQAYRYAIGQVEPSSASIDRLSEGFSSDAKLVDVLLTIVTDPRFVTRRFE